MKNPTDHVLFIDDIMAQLLVAWRRMETDDTSLLIPGTFIRYDSTYLSHIMGLSKGQVMEMVNRAISLEIINRNGDISDLANKMVNSMIGNKLKEFGNK